MKMQQILDARGRGELTYDYAHDILFFKVRERDYDSSLEFDTLVLDFDTLGYLTGLRIFDASKVFRLSKTSLRRLHDIEFGSTVEKNIVSVDLRFVCKGRRQDQRFVREGTGLRDSRVVASA